MTELQALKKAKQNLLKALVMASEKANLNSYTIKETGGLGQVNTDMFTSLRSPSEVLSDLSKINEAIRIATI